MDWARPAYSRSQVDRAGELLAKGDPVTDEQLFHALDVLENWRTSHAYPMHVFKETLNYRAKTTYRSATVVQRLKRFISITGKLRAQPGMKLSRMQDIGGCRAIVSSVALVDRLAHKYKETGYHEYLREFDYIREPKASGYRGIHLIYRYRPTREDLLTYSGMSVEIQLRSTHQHVWATAVEMVDVLTNQNLKGGRGDAQWDRFFALMGSVFARTEGTELVPNTPGTMTGLRKELRDLEHELRAVDVLSASKVMISQPQVAERAANDLFLLRLDFNAKNVRWWTYPNRRLSDATRHLSELEAEARDDPSLNVVLVGAAGLKAVKRAYPNYFMDSDAFLAHVNEALGRRTA